MTYSQIDPYMLHDDDAIMDYMLNGLVPALIEAGQHTNAYMLMRLCMAYDMDIKDPNMLSEALAVVADMRADGFDANAADLLNAYNIVSNL